MIFRFVLLALLAVVSLRAATPPLGEGEAFTYRVSWAVIPGAGEIKISAQPDTTGPTPRLKVTTTTATKGLARFLLTFDAKAESLFDAKTGKLFSLSELTQQKNKKAEHTVAFDYVAAKALYTVPGAPEKSQTIPMPAGDPLDLITALINTRSWNLKPGDSRDALVMFDNEFYELTLRALRYEEISTSLGTFKTVVLEPRMEKGPLKGMFKRGSTVHVWISQDEQHLPVRFEVEFKIGTGTATLTRYQPPTAPAPVSSSTTPSPAPSASAPAATTETAAPPPDEKNPRP